MNICPERKFGAFFIDCKQQFLIFVRKNWRKNEVSSFSNQSGFNITKIAVYDDKEPVFTKTLRNDPNKIAEFGGIIEQFEFRKQLVMEALKENNIPKETLNAVVGRGGLIKAVPGGTFRINKKMLEDLQNPNLWGRIHASN